MNMKEKHKTSAFGARDKIGYMMGDFGCNMSFQLISSYAMIYFTQGMGLSLGDWAIIVVLAKVFDAINDPIIGSLVDRRKPSKNGKFRPWIFWGSFAILLTTLLFFVDIRAFSYGLRFAYCLIMYCLWSIAYTATNVPYGSLNAVLTDDIAQRASLSSIRNIGAGLATGLLMIVMPMLIYGEEDPSTGISPILPERFMWIALAAGLIGMIGFMMLYFMTRERLVAAEKKEKYNFRKALGAFLKNRSAVGISIASFAYLAFFASSTTMVQYVYQVYFKNTDMIIIATIVIAAPMILLIPFVSKLTKRFGKKEISTWPMLGAIVILALMLMIQIPPTSAGAWIYLVLLGLANGCAGFFLLLIWSFVADAVDYQEYRTGRREEGTVYSIYSFVRKLGQAVCQGMISVLLAAVGFDTNNVVATTDATALSVMRLSVALPLVGIVVAFLSMMFIYNLDRKKTVELSEALHARRQQESVAENQ